MRLITRKSSTELFNLDCNIFRLSYYCTLRLNGKTPASFVWETEPFLGNNCSCCFYNLCYPRGTNNDLLIVFPRIKTILDTIDFRLFELRE